MKIYHKTKSLSIWFSKHATIGAVLIALVLFRLIKKVEFLGNAKALLIGGTITGGVSGLAGSGGPIGAVVFLSLGLPPVAYIASEASTATAMHILKTVIYSKLTDVDMTAIFTGLIMGLAMLAGIFAANRFIRKIEKDKFQKYVAILLCVVGAYILFFGV